MGVRARRQPDRARSGPAARPLVVAALCFVVALGPLLRFVTEGGAQALVDPPPAIDQDASLTWSPAPPCAIPDRLEWFPGGFDVWERPAGSPNGGSLRLRNRRDGSVPFALSPARWEFGRKITVEVLVRSSGTAPALVRLEILGSPAASTSVEIGPILDSGTATVTTSVGGDSAQVRIELVDPGTADVAPNSLQVDVESVVVTTQGCPTVEPRGTPANGTLARIDDRTLMYTPNPGWSGNDQVAYALCNDEGVCRDYQQAIEVRSVTTATTPTTAATTTTTATTTSTTSATTTTTTAPVPTIAAPTTTTVVPDPPRAPDPTTTTTTVAVVVLAAPADESPAQPVDRTVPVTAGPEPGAEPAAGQPLASAAPVIDADAGADGTDPAGAVGTSGATLEALARQTPVDPPVDLPTARGADTATGSAAAGDRSPGPAGTGGDPRAVTEGSRPPLLGESPGREGEDEQAQAGDDRDPPTNSLAATLSTLTGGMLLLAALAAGQGLPRANSGNDARSAPGSADIDGVDASFEGAETELPHAPMAEEQVGPLLVSSRIFDRWSDTFPARLGRFSPLAGKIAADASYLRAIFGPMALTLPIVGLGAGICAGLSTGPSDVPALAWVAGLAVVGVADATAGLIAIVAFALTRSVGGHLGSAAEIRVVLGIGALWVTPTLIADAIRPLRRLRTSTWYTVARLVDYVALPLIASFVVTTTVTELQVFAGAGAPTMEVIADARLIGRVVGLAVLMRALAEASVLKRFPARLTLVEPAELDEPSDRQRTLSICFRTALLGFVALAFLPAGWALCFGLVTSAAAMSLNHPAVSGRLPAVPGLRGIERFDGLTRFLCMLVLGRALSGRLGAVVDGPETQLQLGFVLLAIPGQLLTLSTKLAKARPTDDPGDLIDLVDTAAGGTADVVGEATGVVKAPA